MEQCSCKTPWPLIGYGCVNHVCALSACMAGAPRVCEARSKQPHAHSRLTTCTSNMCGLAPLATEESPLRRSLCYKHEALLGQSLEQVYEGQSPSPGNQVQLYYSEGGSFSAE